MKLVLFSEAGGAVEPGLLTGRGVVSIAGAVPAAGGAAPMDTMRSIIDGWDRLKPALQDLEANGEALDLAAVKLHPPLPRPGKMLCCIGNYWEHAERRPRPLNMFLKNPDAVIGPGDTVLLPEFTEPWVFHHEAELAIVIKGPAKNVAAENWRDAVFGYTCMIDVSARGEARSTWRRGSWMGKSFDTFGPPRPLHRDRRQRPCRRRAGQGAGGKRLFGARLGARSGRRRQNRSVEETAGGSGQGGAL